ncbi:hypothetical protein GQ43DRAFT_106434 [Delitschia confertaspora ATCC 74209]|uniref:BZIP domain-containing protein n=1 Tax=Delitschia confertaspora ATCC 74209 TaxID=1513339 RepID=A0A9P4JK10_9PLEO|nr:hypothetical protein GQ43DRAFT_106434 [Delitschia confertaspora ATCC 74209]
MTGYHGRRGPNVSQYVANLNTIPSAVDFVPDPLPGEIDNELAIFTNADFIDWDAGANFDVNQPLEFDMEAEQRARRANASAAKNLNNVNNQNMDKTIDFVNSDFQFADFTGFQNPVVEPSMPALPHSQPHNYQIPQPYTSPVSASLSPITPQFDLSVGKKRKLGGIDPSNQQAIDEAARVAAEEDKRRRNTAASARFRVKKKQREQALEKTAKEMSDKVQILESRITQLEMENNWLKGLITEKNEKSTPDISAMYRKFTEENAAERSSGGRTDGVGTEAGDGKAEA